MLTAELELHGRLLYLVHLPHFAAGATGLCHAAGDASFITLYRYVDALDMDKFPPDFRDRSIGALTFTGAGDAQAFAIFGDGAAGNLDAFAMKFLGDGLVG